MRKIRRALAIGVALLSVAAGTVVAAPAAEAAPCTGVYKIVVAGTGQGTGPGPFRGGVDQWVGYPSIPLGNFTREGVNELNRLIRDQRRACPGQHITAFGFSLGAAVVHTWVTENWMTIGNVNAVLLADPKRMAEGGRGGDGITGQPYTAFIGFPLVGVDRFFGNMRVVSVCTNDVICDSAAGSGWIGYLFQERHGDYNFNVDAYSTTGNGEWFNARFYPY